MVCAVLEDRKTNTRRIMDPQPDEEGVNYMPTPPALDWEIEYGCEWKPWIWDTEGGERIAQHCRYGGLNDLLYVRETHYRFGYWEEEPAVSPGQHKWKFVPDTDTTAVYFEQNRPLAFRISRDTLYPEKRQWYKRLGRFMPKEYARIWLQVTDIRAERLHDIDGYGAVWEGAAILPSAARSMTSARIDYELSAPGYVMKFKKLWESIHGPGSWEANPWVWVVAFKVLSKTGKPQNP